MEIFVFLLLFLDYVLIFLKTQRVPRKDSEFFKNEMARTLLLSLCSRQSVEVL